MITRVFYIPFEFGTDINLTKLIDKKLCGLTYTPLSDLERNIFDSDVIKFAGRNLTLYINEIGFCELLYSKHESKTSFTYESILNSLSKRTSATSGILNNQHKICKYIDSLKNEILFLSKSKRTRDDIMKNITYFSTQYFIDEDFNNIIVSEENKRCFISLLNSRILEQFVGNIISKPFDKYIQRIKGFNLEKKWSYLKDIGDEDYENLYVGWHGSAIFLDKYDKFNLIKVLTVKMELFWSMSAYAETWATTYLDKRLRLDKIDQIEMNISNMLLRSEKLLSYSVSLTHKRIFDEICSINFLFEQISQSKKTLAHLRSYQRFLKNKTDRVTRVLTEYILLLLGFSQIIPLLFKLPIVSLNFNTMSQLIIGIAMVLIYLSIKKANN